MPFYKTGSTFLQGRVFPHCEHNQVYSDETMSGDIFGDYGELAHFLAEINPDAKVVITIRSQSTIMWSSYWLYLKGGGTYSFHDFVELMISRQKFFYDNFLDQYRACFDDVLVMLQEVMAKDGTRFVGDLLNFIGETIDLSGFDGTPINRTP